MAPLVETRTIGHALLTEPRHHLGARAHRPEQARPPARAAYGFVAQTRVAGQHAAGDHAPGAQHARHLGDCPARGGEAVQTGEGDHQVHRAVRERQGADVGHPRHDLVGDAALAGGGHGAVQHRLGDVGGEIGDALPGPQAAQRDPAATRDIEDHGTAGSEPISAAASYRRRRSLPTATRQPRPPTNGCSTDQS